MMVGSQGDNVNLIMNRASFLFIFASFGQINFCPTARAFHHVGEDGVKHRPALWAGNLIHFVNVKAHYTTPL